MTLSPWLGIVLVLAILGLVIAVVKHFSVRLRLHPETSRKAVHVAMGLVTLSFPWVFRETWPVFLLALSAAACLAGLRLVAPLRDRFGGVLNSVDRRSLGEIYFPLAVAILFHLYRGDILVYVIPMLTLTLADAVAALVGLRYGQHRFDESDGAKSTEGSVAFFTVAFLSVLVPLLLLSGTGRAESLLIALVIGILVTLFEAVSVGGFDNLFIPLGCYTLLRSYHSMDENGLLFRLGAISVVAVLVFAWRNFTTLRERSLLAASLIGYMNWTIGGWQWLAVPLAFFLTYGLIWPKSEATRRPLNAVHVVAFIAAPGMIWLMADVEAKSFDCYIPFVVTYAVQSVFVGMVQLEYARPAHPVWKRLMRAVFVTWLIFAPLFFLPSLQGAGSIVSPAGLWAGTSLPLLIIAGIVFHAVERRYSEHRDGFAPWLRRAVIALAISAATWAAFGRTGAVPLSFMKMP